MDESYNDQYKSANNETHQRTDNSKNITADSEKYVTMDSEKYVTVDSDRYVTAESDKYVTAESDKYVTADSLHMDEDSIYQKQLYIRQLTQTEGCFESPIDISISKAKEIILTPLKWVNFEIPPKKLKVTNTGLSLILSAKWKQERPYIHDGPLLDKYVFSNWHLHWGKDPMEGSEHTIDGTKYPVEMHVVTFKSSYLTQEAALKEHDGCTILVYLFKLQDTDNPNFEAIVDALKEVKNPGTSKKLVPIPITKLIRIFTEDYLMYWGSVSTQKCTHYVLWLVTRIPIGISAEQVNALRFIYDVEGKLLTRNFRDVQDSQHRTLFHVCPSKSKYATLLPIGNSQNISHVYMCKVYYGNQRKRMKKKDNFSYAIVMNKSMDRSKTVQKKKQKLKQHYFP